MPQIDQQPMGHVDRRFQVDERIEDTALQSPACESGKKPSTALAQLVGVEWGLPSRRWGLAKD
jgi:hypothetical protein